MDEAIVNGVSVAASPVFPKDGLCSTCREPTTGVETSTSVLRELPGGAFEAFDPPATEGPYFTPCRHDASMCQRPVAMSRPSGRERMDLDVHNAHLTKTPLSGVQAAQLAGVSVHTIYAWRRRGLLKPIASLDGRPVYLGLDVLEVEHKTRVSNKSRRRRAGAEQPAT